MTLSLYCLAPDYRAAHGFDRPLVCDAGVPSGSLAGLRGVVLGTQSEGRAHALLERGAPCVHVADAALDDPESTARLARRFGPDRVGLSVNARRMPNAWTFETVSNADFKVVTPSVCEPTWEVLRADGTPTALRLLPWLESMRGAGAASVLVRVDIQDDDDLNLCAGLVEALGERVCLTPATQREPPIEDWVRHGHARRIALPPALYARYRRALRSGERGSAS